MKVNFDVIRTVDLDWDDFEKVREELLTKNQVRAVKLLRDLRQDIPILECKQVVEQMRVMFRPPVTLGDILVEALNKKELDYE
jgi:hypothetical protein